MFDDPSQLIDQLFNLACISKYTQYQSTQVTKGNVNRMTCIDIQVETIQLGWIRFGCILFTGEFVLTSFKTQDYSLNKMLLTKMT